MKTAFLPTVVRSGSFSAGASNGNVQQPQKFYDAIVTDTNVQGYNPDVAANGGTCIYSDAIKLLKNQDEYDINLIVSTWIWLMITQIMEQQCWQKLVQYV